MIPFENETSKGSSVSVGSAGYISRSGRLDGLQQSEQATLAEQSKKHLAGSVGLLINGLLAVVFGIVWINLKCEISESGVPVWAGLWFIATGVLGIAALKTEDSKCLVKTYAVFSAIDILFAFNVVIIGGVSAATEKPAYDSYTLRVAIDAVLVILGFTGCMIALGCIISVSSVAYSTCLIDKEIKSADGSYLSVFVRSRNSQLGQDYKVFLPLDDFMCKLSSIGHMVCGISCIGFGIGWMTLHCLYSESSSAIFSGVFFIMTGCLGYFATKKPYNTCLLITYTVWCALSILYAGALLSVAITAALKEPHKHKTSQDIRIAFDVILAVVNLLEAFIAIWSIVLVSDVVCGSCSSAKNPYNDRTRNDSTNSTHSTASSSVFVVRGIKEQEFTQSSSVSGQASSQAT